MGILDSDGRRVLKLLKLISLSCYQVVGVDLIVKMPHCMFSASCPTRLFMVQTFFLVIVSNYYVRLRWSVIC